MDRNSTIGLALIFLILVGTYFINRPTVEELERQQHEQDSIAQLSIQRINDSLKKQEAILAARPDSVKKTEDSLHTASQFGAFATLANGTDQKVILENEQIRLTISTKGGAPYSVELKPYKRALRPGETEKQPLILFEGTEQKLNYTFVTNQSQQINTSNLYFTPSDSMLVVNGDSAVLTLTASLDANHYIRQQYTLKKESQEVGYQLITAGFDDILSRSANYLALNWRMEMPLQEKEVKTEREKTSVYYGFVNGDYDNIGVRDYKEESLKESALRWISFKQQFFNSTLIARNEKGFSDVNVATAQAGSDFHVKTLSASLYIPHEFGKLESFDMSFYFGPNHYQMLKATNYGLEELVPLGWGIFGWVNRFIVIPVFNFLNDYIGSFGIIILVLTIIFKALLFPLVYRSYISTAKMRVIKPEMEELKEKFADDPQKLQAENLKLFKKAGVSPLGGCIPLLLQMPILFALFNFFPVSFELRQQAFLWADDLSTYDSIWTFGKIPIIEFIYGDHVSLFTLLMTISTLIYTRLNNEISGITGQMKYIGYIMPVVFLGFFNSYSSGLTYYYFLSNVITFAQQFAIRRFVNEDKIHALIQENKKKPVKKSRFAEKLEALAKQQTAQNRNKKKK